MEKKKLITVIVAAILSILCSVLFISLFGQKNFTIEALQFRLSTQFNHNGITQLEVPPLGDIQADTHKTPVKIIIRLENIDMETLKQFIEETPEQKEIVDNARIELKDVIKQYILKIILLSTLGGAFGAFLVYRNRTVPLLKGAALGFLLAVILIAGTYFSYNEEEFQNPTYVGVLEAAPWMINLAEESFGKIETLSRKMQVVATNLYDLFEQIDKLDPMADNEESIRVLHVSDLHNNPAGMEFITRIATLFNVNFIIDTGDISDFGTPLEGLLLERLERIEQPYYFVPGNHDAPPTKELMENMSGVKVLDNFVDPDSIIESNGLYFTGFADPSSYENNVVPPHIDTIPDYSEEIREKINEVGEDIQLDIIAVHNHRIGKELAGEAPVILFGHNHSLEIQEENDSILINAGTSGASGIRGLQSLDSPYTVALLYFNFSEDGRANLTAVDTISVRNIQQGFSLERRIFNQEVNGGEENIQPAP